MGKRDRDLYEREMDRYRETIRDNEELAYDRYGFTLINSLDPAERASALRSIGFELGEAIDFYNLGCHAAAEENWSEAIVHFDRAMQMNPDLTEAIYNLAICFEKTSHVPKAKATWQLYLSSINDEEERDLINQHLKDLDQQS